jgi:hypothetical protein
MYRAVPLATAAALLAAPLAAQDVPRVFLEGRGGAVIPTFGIADVATTGAALGGTLGYRFSPRWTLMGEVDLGFHEDEATKSVDITTRHFMAKVGYSLTGPRSSGWEASINLGAGAVQFDVDGAPDPFTYFAINAGAKIAYHINRSVALVLSPQGDIAFADEAELSTTTAWVWPVTVGLRVTF